MLVHIDSSYFNAGVVIQNGVVTEAAPILRYMIGWTLKRVENYCKYKKWGCIYSKTNYEYFKHSSERM